MADEEKTNQPNQLPAMPEPYQFPMSLLEQWLAIPPSEKIQSPLTRQEIDSLLFGLLRGAESQAALEKTLVAWSNGQNEEANKNLLDFRRLNIESLNNIRQFFTGLMASALAQRSNAKK